MFLSKIQKFKIALFIMLNFFGFNIFASPATVTFQARIVKPDATNLEGNNVFFRFYYVYPKPGSGADLQCVIYVEEISNVDMTGSKGLVNLQMGTGTRTFGSGNLKNVFDNSTASYACQAGGTYTPSADDNRRVIIQFNDGSGVQTLPPSELTAVPFAMQSYNSQRLGGNLALDFLKFTDFSGTCPAGQFLTYDSTASPKFTCATPAGGGSGTVTSVNSGTGPIIIGGTATDPTVSIALATNSVSGYLSSSDRSLFNSKLSNFSTLTSIDVTVALGFSPVSSGDTVANATNAVNATNATMAVSFSGALSGDVTGTQAATVVSSVGGVTAGQIATSVAETENATNTNTINTLVKRDGSGNVAVNTLSAANLSATNSSLQNLYLFDGANTNRILFKAPAAGITNYTLTLPPTVGTNGQVLSTNASGDLSWIAASTGSVTNVTAGAPLVSSGGAMPNITMPMATVGVDGYLSSTDFTTFNNKLANFSTMTSVDVTTALVAAPVQNATNAVTAVNANGIRGTNVNITALANNNILQFDGTDYVNRNIPTCLGTEYLTFNGTTYSCVTDSGSVGSVASLNVTAPVQNTGTATNPIIAMVKSTAAADGYLSSADFTTFNSKQAAGNYVTTLSGDVTSSGFSSGTVTTTIANDAITSSKILDGTITSSDISAGAITFDKLNQSSATTGQIIKWNGSAWVASADNSNAGVVTSIAATGTANNPIVIGGTSAVPTIDIPKSTASINGYLSSTDFTTFNNKLANFSTMTSIDVTTALGAAPVQNATNAVTAVNFSGSLSGDVSGTQSATSVNKIRGTNVNITALANNNILQFNGTDYVNRNIPTCLGTEYLTFNGTTYSCVTDSGSAGSVASLNVTAPVQNTGTATNPIIAMAKSTAGVDGYLSSTDFTTFNSKLSNFSTMTSVDVTTALSFTPLKPANNLSDVASALTARSNLGLGTASVLNSSDVVLVASMPASCSAGQTLTFSSPTGAWVCSSIILGNNTVTSAMITSLDWTKVVNTPTTAAGYNIPKSTAGVDGYLSSTDFTTFNSKQAAGNYVTTLSGDITSAGFSSGVVTTTIADNSVTSAKILDGTITTSDLSTAITNSLWSVNASGDVSRATGKVGIGVTAPAYALQVSGDVSISGNFKVNGTNILTSSDLSSSYVSKAGDTMTGALNISANSASADLTVTQSGAGPAATFTGGNVGIGTTSPAGALHIRKNNENDIVLTEDSNGTFNWHMGIGVGNTYSQGAFVLGRGTTAGNKRAIEIANDGSSLALFTGDATSSSERMRIDTLGNVGIGTTAPNQQLEITKNFRLPSTTGTTPYGIIYKGGNPFIHDFNYGNNGTVTTIGQNTFVGALSGNFTTGSTATNVQHGSMNTALGYSTLNQNTNGSSNVAIGHYALPINTTGSTNIAIGRNALFYNTTGSANVTVGNGALFYNTTGGLNSAVGIEALFNNIDGNYLVANGYQAGSVIADGATANTTSDSGIYIGAYTKPLADNGQNEIVIGYNATGAGSNSVVLGNNNVVTTLLKGNVGIGVTAPAYALQVSGDVSISGNFKVNGTNILTSSDVSSSYVAKAGDTMTGALNLPGSSGSFGLLFPAGNSNYNISAPGYSVFGGVAINGSGLGGDISGVKKISFNGADFDSTSNNPATFTGSYKFSITNNSGWTPALQVKGIASQTVNLFQIDPSASSNGSYFNVTSTGNVGIGTAAPAYPLHVEGIATDNLAMFGDVDGNNGGVTITRPSDDGRISVFGSFGTEDVRLSAYGNSFFNGGNVGIGTTNPQYKLDLAGGNFRLNNGNLELSTGTGATIYGADNNKIYIDADYLATMAVGTSNFILQSGSAVLKAGTSNKIKFEDVTDLTANGADATQIDAGGAWGEPFIINGRNLSSTQFIFNRGINATTGDLLHVSEYGVDRLVINKDGNVGIGTTTPTAKITIASSDGTVSSAPLKLTSGTNLTTPEAGAVEFDGTNLYFTDSGATRRTLATTTGVSGSYVAKAGDTMSGVLNITAGSASADLSVTQSGAGPAATFMGGNVGVGTNLPVSKLDVVSNGATLPIVARNTSTNSAGDYTGIGFATESVKAGILYNPDEGSFGIGSIIFSINNVHDYSGPTLANEKMRISHNGNVGIGVTNPSYALQVSGDVSVSGNFKVNGTNILTSSDVSSSYVSKSGDTMTGALNISGNSASADLTVTQSGTGPAATFMGGNVGIGKTNPSYVLDVYNVTTDAIRGSSTSGNGVVGTSSSGIGVTGTSSSGIGVIGTSSSNYGLRGSSSSSDGVYGSSSSGNGGYFSTSSGYAGIFMGGNVGIGTTNPDQKLKIYNGEAPMLGVNTVSNETVLNIYNQATYGAGVSINGNTGLFTWDSGLKMGQNNGLFFRPTATGSIKIVPYDGSIDPTKSMFMVTDNTWGAPSGYFHVKEDGNVLIGTNTNNSGYKLQVGGAATISGNVGIGVTAPAYALQVSGDVSISGNFKINGVNISSGTVTSVTAGAPLLSSGGATPNITLPMATNSVNGYLSSSDFTAFNNKLSNFSTLTSVDVITALGTAPVQNATTAVNFSGVLSGDITGTQSATTISNNSVTTTKINNLAITDAKINDVAFAKITGLPTTLAGYGITNALTGTGTNGKIARYTASATLADSIITESTGQIGIAGQIVSTGATSNGAATTFNFNNGNAQYTTAACAAITLQNMVDGGSYTVAVKNTSGTCTFAHGADTIKYAGGGTDVTITSHTIFSFLKMGTDIYVTWVSF